MAFMKRSLTSCQKNERTKFRLSNMTESERAEYNSNRRERKRRRNAKLTPEELLASQRQERERHRLRRANMTQKARAERQNKDRERKRLRTAKLAPEELSASQRQERERHRLRHANMTEKARAERQKKDRERIRLQRSNMTQDEQTAYNAKRRLYYQAKLSQQKQATFQLQQPTMTNHHYKATPEESAKSEDTAQLVCDAQIKTEPEDYNEFQDMESDAEDWIKNVEVKVEPPDSYSNQGGETSIGVDPEDRDDEETNPRIESEPRVKAEPLEYEAEPAEPDPSPDTSIKFNASGSGLTYSLVHINGRPVHTYTVPKPFQCSFEGCFARFPDEKSLRRHIHPKKALACPTTNCRHKFQDMESLREHVVNTHMTNNAKWYKCKFPGCDLSFVQRQELLVHVQSHPSEILFACAYAGCQRVFSRRCELDRHALVHTGNDPPANMGRGFQLGFLAFLVEIGGS